MSDVDPSIPLSLKPLSIENPMDVQAKAYTLKQLGLQTQTAQQDYDDSQTIRALYQKNSSATGLNQDKFLSDAYGAGVGTKALEVQKQLLANQQTQSQTAKNTADANSAQSTANTGTYNLQQAKLTDVNNRIASLVAKPNLSRQDVIDQVNQLTDQHALDAGTRDQMMNQIPQNPADLKDFLVRIGTQNQTVQQQITARQALAPKIEYQDAGGSRVPVDTNALTNPNPQPIKKTVSPDTLATLGKDYTVAGLNPDGSASAADGPTIDAIGQGRMAPPSGAALLNPKNRRLMDDVMAKYPDYDYTTVAAKKAAAVAFTSGKEGNSLRSIGTATKHLDMLDGMVSALDNGNTPLLNKLGNAFAAQTGSTAPTNFDAAKEIVGQEVIKGIVAGGGGVSERQEAAAALDKAKTPAQLRGVISTYKSIMGAQHESLLQQRDAAGLPRSTLPDYTEGAPGAAGAAPATVPSDIAAILAKHGGK